MTKRKCSAFVQDFTKKLKLTSTKKRHATTEQQILSKSEQQILSKRQKVYQYWHEASLTREQRAFNMAKIYEHLLLCKYEI